MPAHWYTGIVKEIKSLSNSVRSFTLEIPEVSSFDFKAGQFITFDLPVGEKRLQRWRSYSIASAPMGNNVVEMCIVNFGGGLGSTYFFNEIKIGTELKFKAAEGGFVLPDVVDHDIVMICTGTGVAPFRSMLYDIHINKKVHKNIHLIFGTRKKDDILYYDEFIELTHKIKGFTYDIALSRESDLIKTKNIHNGYVHPIYMNEYSTTRNDIHFYICGWSAMIDDAVANLLIELKYPRENIHYELYG